MSIIVMSKEIEFYSQSEDRGAEESLAFLMVKNALIFERLADIRLAPLDITSSQTRVLMMIGCAGFTMASVIAKRMGTNAAGVVRSIDKLEAKGWIERVRSEEDRREVHLNLTPAGEKLISQIPLYMNETLNSSLNGFSQEEFQMLVSSLKRVADNNLAQLQEYEKEGGL
jgi:DNA-binding MarR family transcriptional regulator